MADDVLVLVTRESGYWRGGQLYPQGSSLSIPPAAVRAAERAEPPFVRRITRKELERLTNPGPDATEEALALAEECGLDLMPYDGRGSGDKGRIIKRDVEAWTKP